MFFPEGHIRAYVYGQPVDMRKSFDGLYALTRQGLQQDPLSGSLFCFINKRGSQVKILYFDRTGLCIWAKRLERGSFVSHWSQVRTREMDWTGLKLLLEGIEPGRQKKRYQLPRNIDENRGISTGSAVQLTHGKCGIERSAECL